MIVRGGGKKKAGNHSRCDCLYLTEDQSLLLKNPAFVCASYKMELLKDATGHVQTRCIWAMVEGGAIFCTEPNNS